MSTLVKGFMSFVREQGVVGIAVGIAIGIQAAVLVDEIVDGFINPIIGIILQGTDLTGIRSTVEVGDSIQSFEWGAILQAAITFVATAFVVYLLVKKMGLEKADKSKD